MRLRTALFALPIIAIILVSATTHAGDDDAILPYLDDNSFLIVRVDESALNFKSDLKWLTAAMESAKLDAHEFDWIKEEIGKRGLADEWVKKFRAAGGKRIYLVLGLSDIPNPGPFVVVPLGGGADEKALAALFPTVGADEAEKIGAALVFGHKKSRDRLKHAPAPKPRPEMDLAMAAVAPAPARAVVIPSTGTRQMLEMVSPKLPKELGGGPIGVVSQGVRWAAVGMHPPGEPSVTVIIEAKDADAAKELLKLEGAAVQWALLNGKPAKFDYKMLFNFVMPKIEGSRITVSLTSDQIHNMAVDVAAPALGRMRNSTAASHCLNTLRQLAFACEFHASKHQDKWPDSLDDAAEAAGGNAVLEQLKAARSREGLTPHFVYRKPGDASKKRDQTILIYEAFDGKTPAMVGVVYVDGHAELMNGGELKKKLEAGEKKE